MRCSGSQSESPCENSKFGRRGGDGCRCRCSGNGNGNGNGSRRRRYSRRTKTAMTTKLLVLASCTTVALGASGDNAFQWKFNNMFSQTLNQCQSYQIIAQAPSPPRNTSLMGTPPFYMIAFKPEGVTTRSFIGTDPNNLTWTVDQPEGSRLLLTVADSLMLSGGQPPQFFNVTAGSSSSCLPPAPTTNITVVTNITNVETCRPVGFRVFGGQMPYNLSIAALNSPVVTNVTMGPNDDVFTFINRADPNGQFLAAISDANGVWATSTPMISTYGSATIDCVGLVSTSGNHQNVDQHPAPPAKSKTATIVLAVLIPLLVIIIAAIGGWWWWRRKREERMREPEPAFLPDAWSAPVTASSMGASDAGAGSLAGVPMGVGGSSEKARYFAVPQIHFTGSGSGSGSGSRGGGADEAQTQFGVVGAGGGSSSYADASSTTSYPYPSGSGSSSGAAGAANDARRSNSTTKGRRLYGHAATNSSNSAGLGPNGLPSTWQVEPQILIQHRDGGRVPVSVPEGAANVQEIPPPYMFDTVNEEEEGALAGPSGQAGPSSSGGGAGGSSPAPPAGAGVRQLPPLPLSPQSAQTSRPGSSGSGLHTPVMSPTPVSPSTARSPPPPISPPPPPGIPPPPRSQPTSPQPDSQSHSHTTPPPSLPNPYAIDASRYSAPLPNLPGPLPPPPATTGLPSNPAALLRMRQEQGQGQSSSQTQS